MSMILHINGQPVTLEALERKGQEVRFRLGEKHYAFCGGRTEEGVLLEQEVSPGVWQRTRGAVAPAPKGAKRVQLGALEATIAEARGGASAASHEAALSPPAPMPGLVRQVMVKAGEEVAKGQPLIMMEAMKLQMTLPAGADAIVEAVLVAAGDMVAEGAELVRLKAKT